MTLTPLVPVVPCAHQNYVQQHVQYNAKSDLSGIQSQLVFQNWVAFERNFSPDVDGKEHRTCPLLWCRLEFEDVQSCLRHLLHCPCRSDAWYWCPHCRRPELFIYSEDKVHNPVRRKDSKLKRAVTFFKHFRRKTSHAEHHMPPLQYPKNQELDDSSREELDSSFSPELDGELCQELSACPPHPPRERSYLRPEMSRQSLSNYHSIGRLDGYYSSSELGTAGDSPDSSMSALHVQNYSLAHTKIALNIPTPWPSPIELLSTEPSTNNQGSYTHHLDISSSSRAAIELDASMCVDLVEADHGIPMSKPPIQATSCGSSELSKVPPHLVEASNDFRSKQYPSPQSLVQELRDCVEIYANHWSNILKLQLDTMEFSLYTTDTLFKTGHQTLKQVYEGVLPHTFEEVYSMMHIVYASVSILHHDDASFSWDLLFQHVIRWHRAIIDNAKSDLFLKVAGILWSPPEFLKSLNLVYCDLYSPATLPLMTGIQVSKISRPFHRQDLTKENQSSLLQPISESATIEPLQLLKKGLVIHVYSQYLDYVEYAQICEYKFPTTPKQHTARAQWIYTSLIEPLMIWNDSKSSDDYSCDSSSNIRDRLSRQIEEATIMTCSGLLKNIREAEVRLVFGCRCEYIGHPREKKFLDKVLSLCNATMLEAGSSWRDRHYATDMDLVLATYMELNNKGRRENRFANQVKPVNTILLSRDSNLDTYTSPSSASSKNSSSFTSPTSSSTSPTSSFTDYTTNFTSPTSGFTESISSFTDSTSQASSPYLGRLHSDSRNSNASFGSELSQQASSSYPASKSLKLSSNSALELPAPVPQKTSGSLHSERGAGMMPSSSSTKSTDSEVIYCQSCDTPIRGPDRRSNLKRHFKYSHGPFSSYPCPNCGKSFKRPDARLKHMRQKHQPDLSASISISELEDKSTES